MQQAASSYSIRVAIIVNVQLEMVHNMWLRAVQELQWLVKERVTKLTHPLSLFHTVSLVYQGQARPPLESTHLGNNWRISTKGIKKVLMTTTSQRTNSPTSAARSCIELDE
ncbi:hypothetical protein ACLKA6_010020 [Drosophila palustris]